VRFATLRIGETTSAVRVEGERLRGLDAADVGSLLNLPSEVRTADDGPMFSVADAWFGPVITRPGKIICVGLNYRNHILEMGRPLPAYPALFAKYPEALIGPSDDILLPEESSAVDWEAELAVVIGRSVRRASEESACRAIAGFAVLNDVTMRDWQYRTPMWLQGKTFESSTPLGPYLVTPDELPGEHRPDLAICCSVDGREVQSSRTSDLVFDPVALVRYISTVITLHPGDVIATGTPGGVGHARSPQEYLSPGAVLVTEIEGLGFASNVAVAERLSTRGERTIAIQQ